MGQRESRRNTGTKIFLITFSHLLSVLVLGGFFPGNASFFICNSIKKPHNYKKF